jgi:hypothetical protein
VRETDVPSPLPLSLAGERGNQLSDLLVIGSRRLFRSNPVPLGAPRYLPEPWHRAYDGTGMKVNFKIVTRWLRPVLLASAGVVALAPGGARADEIAPVEQAPGPAAPPAAGGYGGVTPGATAANPLPQPPPGSSPYLIWTGFQPTASGSRVFLQTTAPVEFDVNTGSMSKGKSTMTVLLRGCRIHMANNRRKLDTRAFPTPVQSVSAKQHGKDVELLIALREGATVTSGTEPGPNGSRFVVLDFPPGKATPIESKPPARAETDSSAPSSGEGWSLSEDTATGPTKGNSKPKGKGRASKSGEVVGSESSPSSAPTAK